MDLNGAEVGNTVRIINILRSKEAENLPFKKNDSYSSLNRNRFFSVNRSLNACLHFNNTLLTLFGWTRFAISIT